MSPFHRQELTSQAGMRQNHVPNLTSENAQERENIFSLRNHSVCLECEYYSSYFLEFQEIKMWCRKPLIAHTYKIFYALPANFMQVQTFMKGYHYIFNQ
jgi:hypothetical protein